MKWLRKPRFLYGFCNSSRAARKFCYIFVLYEENWCHFPEVARKKRTFKKNCAIKNLWQLYQPWIIVQFTLSFCVQFGPFSSFHWKVPFSEPGRRFWSLVLLMNYVCKCTGYSRFLALEYRVISRSETSGLREVFGLLLVLVMKCILFTGLPADIFTKQLYYILEIYEFLLFWVSRNSGYFPDFRDICDFRYLYF